MGELLAAGTVLGHYGVMTGAGPEHGRLLSAKLLADDRLVTARPLAISGVGQASGLAVLARCESDVFEASCCLPGRVLVLAGSAISRRTIPIVVKGAHLATFSSLVVLGDDPGELAQFVGQTARVPAVAAGSVDDSPLDAVPLDAVPLDAVPGETLPVPVPMVLVDRKSDQYWLSKATRVTVTVSNRDQDGLDLVADRVIDVRLERRRRATQFATVAATPGVVRR